MMNKWRKKR